MVKAFTSTAPSTAHDFNTIHSVKGFHRGPLMWTSWRLLFWTFTLCLEDRCSAACLVSGFQLSHEKTPKMFWHVFIRQNKKRATSCCLRIWETQVISPRWSLQTAFASKESTEDFNSARQILQVMCNLPVIQTRWWHRGWATGSRSGAEHSEAYKTDILLSHLFIFSTRFLRIPWWTFEVGHAAQDPLSNFRSHRGPPVKMFTHTWTR